MSEEIKLAAETRTAIGTGVKALRRANKVPAVVYGHKIAPSHIQLDLKEVTNTLRKAGRNSLITLNVDGGTKMVLTREVQRDAIKRVIQHIDFYEVSMTEKIRADVRVVPEGSPAEVKGGSAILLQEMNFIEIECLPVDLFDKISIDVSALKIDDVIRVKDLVVPATVKILDDGESEVVRVSRFVEAKVEEAAVAETGEVEVIEKGKKDEEGEAEKKPAAKK